MVTTSGMTLSTFDALRRVEGLELCSPRDLRRIEAMLDQLTVAPGVRLLTQGRVAGQAFVVVEGRLGVTVDGRQIACLGPGELAGESTVLDHLPCSATVEATDTCRLLVLGASAFDTLLAEPALARAVFRAFNRTLASIDATTA